MTERERRARELRTLVARIGRDREAMESVHARLQRAIERVRSEGADDVTLGAVALYLQNVYSALEVLFRRIAIELDGSVPAGEDWHRELVEQMTLKLPDVRPPIADDEMHRDLDLLRRFRHFARHAYVRAYEWQEMQEPLASERRLMDSVPAALDELERFVERTAEALEQPDS